MERRAFKVHTDNLGRLSACIKKGMYGVSQKAITMEMPHDLLVIASGDMVFISERDISHNALFGPFYVVKNRPGIAAKGRKGLWIDVDTKNSQESELAYWIQFEDRHWCILFDKTLVDRISVVWPHNWKNLQLDLPSWGLINHSAVKKLIDFSTANEQEAKEFLKKHDAW